jgi:hypothetical protein
MVSSAVRGADVDDDEEAPKIEGASDASEVVPEGVLVKAWKRALG